ncbi:hypothetical protein ACFY4C_20595 [Actinomadura viridis]|uniref:hypothetical protein n=1 Tax=Actinomadura viridis TaxID=58110 RepID=UPI0036B403B7
MIRAYIREDIAGMTLAITLVQESEGRTRHILRIVEGGSNTILGWEELPDHPDPNIDPTLRLRDSEAHALLEALTSHYKGAEDTRALRRDYDAERERVDRLTETLGAIVGNLSGLAYAVNTSERAEPVPTAEQWRKTAEEGRGPR